MGTCASTVQRNGDDGPIDPEHLNIALAGKTELEEFDYFSRATKALDGIRTRMELFSEPILTEEYTSNIDDSHKMSEPEPFQMENGYARCRDASINIASKHDLGKAITGQMITWWYNNCENSSQFKWTHPYSHKSFEFDQKFYSSMSEEREPEYFIGHTQKLEMVINNKSSRFHYLLVDPSQAPFNFDLSNFEANNITSCICIEIYMEYKPFGYILIGYQVLLTKFDSNTQTSELFVRYWLGNIHKDSTGFRYISSFLINSLGSRRIIKRFYLSDEMARNIYILNLEEIECLKEILPHYYASKVENE